MLPYFYSTICKTQQTMSNNNLYNGLFLVNESAGAIVDRLHQFAFDVFNPLYREADQDESTMRACIDVVADFERPVFDKYARELLRRHPDFEDIILETLRSLAATTPYAKRIASQMNEENKKIVITVDLEKDDLFRRFVKAFLITLSRDESLKTGRFLRHEDLLASTVVIQKSTRTVLWNLVDLHVQIKAKSRKKRARKKKSIESVVSQTTAKTPTNATTANVVRQGEAEDAGEGIQRGRTVHKSNESSDSDGDENKLLPSDSVSQVFAQTSKREKREIDEEPSITIVSAPSSVISKKSTTSLTSKNLKKFTSNEKKTYGSDDSDSSAPTKKQRDSYSKKAKSMI